MGLTRNDACEIIDRELRAMFAAEIQIECMKDTYSEDYIIWVTAADEVHPIRVTIDEYRDEDWKGNVRAAIELLSAQSQAGEEPGR